MKLLRPSTCSLVPLFHPKRLNTLTTRAYCTNSQNKAAMAPANTAAWLNSAKETPLVVRESTYQSPEAGEILIKNEAYAVNPLDNKIQDLDLFNAPKPLILGLENAGVVEEVGDGVTRLKKGDRVAA